jgi:mono/diheme cytochrome c family protein
MSKEPKRRIGPALAAAAAAVVLIAVALAYTRRQAPAEHPTPQAPEQAAEGAPAAAAKTEPQEAPAASAANPQIAALPAATFDPTKPYTYANGKVNKATYLGYMRYGMYCFHCHGPDGLGSSYAPNLTLSLKSMSYEDFVQTVMNGRNAVSSSTFNVMPEFGTDPNVVNYIDNIYAYLKGRSDGVIPRGRPEYLGQKKLD